MLDHDHVRQTAQHPKREILQKWYIWFSCGNYGTKLVFYTQIHDANLPSCYYQPMPSASTPSTLFRHQRLFLRWFPDFRWVDFPQRNFLQVKRGQSSRIHIPSRGEKTRKDSFRCKGRFQWKTLGDKLIPPLIDRKSWNNGINSYWGWWPSASIWKYGELTTPYSQLTIESHRMAAFRMWLIDFFSKLLKHFFKWSNWNKPKHHKLRWFWGCNSGEKTSCWYT